MGRVDPPLSLFSPPSPNQQPLLMYLWIKQAMLEIEPGPAGFRKKLCDVFWSSYTCTEVLKINAWKWLIEKCYRMIGSVIHGAVEQAWAKFWWRNFAVKNFAKWKIVFCSMLWFMSGILHTVKFCQKFSCEISPKWILQHKNSCFAHAWSRQCDNLSKIIKIWTANDTLSNL